MSKLKITVGPETIALANGLQPFVFQTHTGRLVLTAQLPPQKPADFPGIWATVVSDDHGATWRTKTFPNAPGASPFHEGAAASLADGTIVLFEWSARGPQPGGNWIARRWESHDDFNTIRGPFESVIHLPQAKGGFDDMNQPVPELFLHRSLLPLPNGSLLMTAYGWFEGDDTPSAYVKNMNRFRNILLKSDDRGETWHYVSTMACDPSVGEEGFNEPVLVRVSRGSYAPGRLVALHRTGSNKATTHNPIYANLSDDSGATWTTPAPVSFETVDPDLIELSDGTLAATCGHRTAESRAVPHASLSSIGQSHGNYIAFSFDCGESWSTATQVTTGPSSCYTTLREIAPGRLLFIYDIGDFWTRTYRGYEGQPRGIGARVITVAST